MYQTLVKKHNYFLFFLLKASLRRKELRPAKRVALENATDWHYAELALESETELVTSSTTLLPKNLGNASEVGDKIVLAETVEILIAPDSSK